MGRIPLFSPSSTEKLPAGYFVEASSEAGPLHHPENLLTVVKRGSDPGSSTTDEKQVIHLDTELRDHYIRRTALKNNKVVMMAKVKPLQKGDEIIEVNQSPDQADFNGETDYLHYIVAKNHSHFVQVCFSPEYLTSLLPRNEPWADRVMERVERNERLFDKVCQPLCLAQLRAIQNLTDCSLGGKLGSMMLEASVRQVVLLQLSRCFLGSSSAPEKMAGRDRDLAYALKRYLDDAYLEEHTIQRLAKTFGTNTNKLMLVFKKAVGQSVFAYITGLRMEHAKHLLDDHQMKILAIARHLGYKNPNHFSAAFKKMYGLGPTEYRRKHYFEAHQIN
jgi:AraC-like DNA-binding protein